MKRQPPTFFTAARLFARFAAEEIAHDAGTRLDPKRAVQSRLVWNGIRIAIENPFGSVREGSSKDGTVWRTRMACDYGYFEDYKGFDGDELDVMIGPDLASENVFVVDQKSPDGSFDESKVVIGTPDIAAARDLYLSNYQEGQDLNIRNILPMTLAEFKTWLADGQALKGRGAFACFADFSRADFTESPFVNVPALLSRTGDYTDKGISLSEGDFDRAAASVSPASPVKMNMAHLRRGSVLDDAGLGEIHRTWRQGQELWGEIAVPQWLASLARERGLKLPVSAEWDIKTKTLRGCAWERTPRITDAGARLT